MLHLNTRSFIFEPEDIDLPLCRFKMSFPLNFKPLNNWRKPMSLSKII